MVRSHVMTAKRRAALRKAQLASARKRRKVGRVNKRADKRIRKHTNKAARGTYTHSEHGGIYMTARAAKSYNKAVRVQNKRTKKVSKINSKKSSGRGRKAVKYTAAGLAGAGAVAAAHSQYKYSKAAKRLNSRYGTRYTARGLRRDERALKRKRRKRRGR